MFQRLAARLGAGRGSQISIQEGKLSNFSSHHEHEAFIAKYGELHTGILDQCLGIVAALANHTLSETEARTRALATFEDLMQCHVPACHATVAEYQARVNAQNKAECDARAAYHERQQSQKQAEAERQKKAAEAADRANRAAAYREQQQF